MTGNNHKAALAALSLMAAVNAEKFLELERKRRSPKYQLTDEQIELMENMTYKEKKKFLKGL